MAKARKKEILQKAYENPVNETTEAMEDDFDTLSSPDKLADLRRLQRIGAYDSIEQIRQLEELADEGDDDDDGFDSIRDRRQPREIPPEEGEIVSPDSDLEEQRAEEEAAWTGEDSRFANMTDE